MGTFRIGREEIDVWSAADGGERIARLGKGTLVEREEGRVDASKIRVLLHGWIRDPAALLGEAPGQPDAELSNARFSVDRRRAYVESILEDRDRKNFLRPARQAWDRGLWIHGWESEDGAECFTAAADWAASQDQGRLVIVQPTRKVSRQAFQNRFRGAPRSTFCNFNVSYCYQQAYGGINLQDPNGSAPGQEVSANAMVVSMRAEWRKVTPAEAAHIANAGGFVIVGWQNNVPTRSGHVMFLLEGSAEDGKRAGLKCFHVGSGEPRVTTVGAIFPSTAAKVEYFVDPPTYAEWTGRAEVEVAPATAAAFSIETDLRQVTRPLTPEGIDAYLQKHGSPLAGIGRAVIDASRKYGINPTYIVAHAIHETGWGSSRICREKNNLFGWSAFDSSPFASAGRFPTREDCIDYVMGRVNALYLTPGGKYFHGACLGNAEFGMNAKYATDPRWGEKIAAIARRMEQEVG